MKYRKVRLNPDILAMMFKGFRKKLFIGPKENEILYVEEDNYDCTMYFENSYWTLYLSQLGEAYEKGNFAKSNANDSWMSLYEAIQSATESDLPNHYEVYPSFC